MPRKNDAIAQVVADVFQVKVQRLAVSGSVALGAALRAASEQGGLSLEEMESIFCQPEADSILMPQASPDVYELSTQRVAELIVGGER